MSAFQACNPATGELLPARFQTAAPAEIEAAVAAADAAFASYGRADGAAKARFLRAIAARLEAAVESLVAAANLETALPPARLRGETARTCGQLRLFAQVVEEGSWVMPRIDPAQAREGAPPKPDLRSMLRPIGPVAVFGASNFPLAFSVAGGDTASALAAGCPVVVKAHPAHPATSALAAEAIRGALAECGLPAGVFSLLFDGGYEVGTALARHPLIRAVAFTGSLAGGRHLMDLAAARPEPIPVFAEMSSVNPVFILPGALAERGAEIAAGLHASVTLGAGQFCTKPGLVLLPSGPAADPLLARLGELMGAAPAFTLLTAGIARSFAAGAAARAARPDVESLAQATPPPQPGAAAAAALFQTEAAALLADPSLADELFGPATLIVRHLDPAQLLAVARSLRGHLTATVHGTEPDLRAAAELLAVLETKVGRIVINGFPTGVEVSPAMVHGGPYPATSDGRSTSVGSQAIFRFARPVCFQDAPSYLLPPELR